MRYLSIKAPFGNQPPCGIGWMVRELIYFYRLQLLLYQALANDSKNYSFTSLITVKNISFFSNGVCSRLAATSSMLCLFLDQNKDYRPEDGFPASCPEG